MTIVTVEYDCGYATAIPTRLRDDQSALHQPAAIGMAVDLCDAEHEANCQTCTSPSKEVTNA